VASIASAARLVNGMPDYIPPVYLATPNALARLLSTGAGSAPDPAFQPPELRRRVGTVDMFTTTPDAGLDRLRPTPPFRRGYPAS